MNLADLLRRWRQQPPQPAHLRFGRLGEEAARRHLANSGLDFLTANFRSPRGEIDLIFRHAQCLVFVEVKTRSSEEWMRPAASVDRDKRRRLSRAAFDYLKRLHEPRVPFRFDIVEVLLDDGQVAKVRHLPNAFHLVNSWKIGG